MSRNRKRATWARRACHLLGSAALAVCISPAASFAADTTQDFNATFNPVPPPAAWTLGGPGASIQPGSITATPGGSFLRVSRDGIEGDTGNAGLSQFAGHTGAYDQLVFGFDFNLNDPASGADGLGFVYLNTANYGTAGASPQFGEEANATNSFGIGFDTFNNAASDGGADDGNLNSVSLHYNNAILSSTAVSTLGVPATWLENGVTKHATVTVTPDGFGNSTVHLLLTDGTSSIEPFGGVGSTVSGIGTYDGRVAFSSRTGGANQNADVDNVVATFTPTGGGAPIVGTQNFDTPLPPPQTGTVTGGTPFSAQQHGDGPGGSVQASSSLPAGGVGDGYYRLTPEVGGNQNTIAFDKTLPTVAAGGTVNLSFDLRMLSGEPSHADGMSVMLLDTATYGSTGPLPQNLNGVVVEDPNVAGIVGIAFDTFDNDENFAAGDPNGCGGGGPCADRLGNITSAHSNGSQVDVQFVPDDALDTPAVANDTISFVNGNWIHVDATITLADNGSGGLGGFLDVVLTDTVTGNTFQPFAGIALPSVPQDLRLAFGARTGGAFDEHAVDNIMLSFTPVPEPSTFVLFGLAGVGLYVARRRRK